jgi:hypothetical protein
MAEVVGTIASAIQLVDTALKAREYIKHFKNAPAEQKNVFTEMQDLQPLLTELRERVAAIPAKSTLNNMKAPLNKFNTMMSNLTAKFELPDGRWSKFSKQLLWTLWNEKETKEYLAELESVKSLINIWLGLGSWCVMQNCHVQPTHYTQACRPGTQERP